jgi:tetratricopeptide (TPR) repeat protein
LQLGQLRGAGDTAVALPRPRLPRQADTNDARAYYNWAAPRVLYGEQLDSADMALYWACRLDPSWADPIYARAVVILRALREDVFLTFRETGSVRATQRVGLTPRQLQLVDSLQRVAWARNPFLNSEVDFRDFVPITGKPTPERRGWGLFKSGHVAQANGLFAAALRQHPGEVGLRVLHAQTLFLLQRYDSAVGELETGRDSLRRILQEHIAVVLPSIEMFEYAIGVARVQQDDFPAARAAFQRALTENLAFYWAHARLAGTSLFLGDTAAALTELKTAVEIEGHDPALRFYYGATLHGARRLEEAEQQLRAAIELDSDYASPRYWLGAVDQEEGKIPEAIEQYRAFLARAPKRDPDRATVNRALVALGTTPPDSR